MDTEEPLLLTSCAFARTSVSSADTFFLFADKAEKLMFPALRRRRPDSGLSQARLGSG